MSEREWPRNCSQTVRLLEAPAIEELMALYHGGAPPMFDAALASALHDILAHAYMLGRRH